MALDRSAGARRLVGIALALAAVAALAALAAPAATAQQEEACRKPVLVVADAPRAWEPGSRFPLQIAVENPNELPVESVTARLQVSQPPGWSASLAQTSLNIGPENVTMNTLTITAPQRGNGVTSGEVVLTVQFTCHRAGGVDAGSQASHVLPVELAPIRLNWLLLGGGLFALLVVVGVAWAVRARLPHVTVRSSVPEKALPPGKGAQFPLLVGNRRREPDGVVLTVGEVPPGWTAHLAVDELDLEPSEERSLWLMVRSPPGAHPGDALTLTVRASSRKNPREVAYVDVTARVEAPT